MTFIPTTLSQIDTNNSTTSNLSSGQSYTGTATLTNGYNSIDLTINSSHDSSAGGIKVQLSDNSTTWTTYSTDTYYANTFYTKNIKLIQKYYRVTYTNGDTTTTFSLSSRLNTTDPPANLTNIYSNLNDFSNDAFGRFRISNPFTLIDVQYPGYTGPADFEKNNLIMNYSTSNNFTNTPNFGYTILSGTGSGYQINQTRKYCNYQPGKSLLFLTSAILYASGPTFPTATSDYQNRVGFFDDKNGLFYEFDSKDGIAIVVRNNSSDTKVLQNNWNIDKFNGSGTSGYNLQFDKSQIFVIDFEWLGVGRIRFGFYISGLIYYCHQITNINALTSPYMRSPNLPVRCEIRGSNVAQTNTVSLRQICSSIISEGGYNPVGYPFSISNGITTISVSTSETAVLVLLGSTGNNYYHENIVPTSLSIVESTAGSPSIIIYRLRLYLAPNSPGTLGSLSNVNVNSRCAYTTTITGFTANNSIIVTEGYFQGKSNILINNLTNVFSNFTQLSSNINNVSDILVLTAQTISGTTNVLASLDFTEAY